MSNPTKNIVELNDLMNEYHGIIDYKNHACETIDAQIAGLQETRRMLSEPFDKQIAELEAKMRQPMLDRAATFVCAYGNINFRKGVVRRTWNSDALDQICRAKPEVKEQIWAFREEKTGEPSISIKLE